MLPPLPPPPPRASAWWTGELERGFQRLSVVDVVPGEAVGRVARVGAKNDTRTAYFPWCFSAVPILNDRPLCSCSYAARAFHFALAVTAAGGMGSADETLLHARENDESACAAAPSAPKMIARAMRWSSMATLINFLKRIEEPCKITLNRWTKDQLIARAVIQYKFLIRFSCFKLNDLEV